MCDLLAYHDILADLSQNSSNTNTTTLSSAQNTTEDPVIVLLRANIEDSCVWVSARDDALVEYNYIYIGGKSYLGSI